MEAGPRGPVTCIPEGGGGGPSCCGARWPGWRWPPSAAPLRTVSGGPSREGRRVRSAQVPEGLSSLCRGPLRLSRSRSALSLHPGRRCTPRSGCVRGPRGVATGTAPAVLSGSQGWLVAESQRAKPGTPGQGSAVFHAGELTSFKGPPLVLQSCPVCLCVEVLKLHLVADFSYLGILKASFPVSGLKSTGGNSGTGSSRQLVKALQPKDFMLDAILDPKEAQWQRRGAA